jgi:DNA-binding MarR family transcriptional regulator
MTSDMSTETAAEPPGPAHRAELHVVLARAGRDLGKAAVMLNGACAERLGLHPTEWECVALLMDALPGSLTAGQLAEETGLTTGAVTGVLDRLEGKRWVRRERDPNDRRRVIVRLLPEQPSLVTGVLSGLQDDMLDLQEGYSEEDLRACAALLFGASEVLRSYALTLRAESRREPAD